MSDRTPVKIEFTISSITEGIEYWLNTVVLRENIVVDNIIFRSHDNTFSVTLSRGIQVGQKL